VPEKLTGAATAQLFATTLKENSVIPFEPPMPHHRSPQIRYGNASPRFLSVLGAAVLTSVASPAFALDAAPSPAGAGGQLGTEGKSASVQESSSNGSAQQKATEEAANPATAIVDNITFGVADSEQKHGLKAENSKSLRGGLDEPARKLLAGGSRAWEGGTLEWTMNVDPERQNYVTARFWGSDKGEELGRLLLYIDGKQLGYRGAGDYSTLNQADQDAEAPGRFFYETLPLPLQMTKGKSYVTLKLTVLGPRWVYGSTFALYQKP